MAKTANASGPRPEHPSLPNSSGDAWGGDASGDWSGSALDDQPVGLQAIIDREIGRRGGIVRDDAGEVWNLKAHPSNPNKVILTDPETGEEFEQFAVDVLK